MNITIPGPIVIVDPNGTEAVTVKDETDAYPDVYSLDVNIRSGIVQVKLSGENLRYEKMTEDQNLTNGSYITIYEKTATTIEKMIWARCVFSNNNVNVKLTVDSNIVVDDFHLQELYSDYQLDTSLPGITELEFIRTEKQGRILVLTFPNGMEFDTSFKIEAKANANNITMDRGMIVRSAE